MLYVNLLPWRSIQQCHRQRVWLRHLVLFLTLTLVLMSLWLGITQHAVQVQQNDVNTLSDGQTRLAVQLKKVSDATLKLQALQKAATEHEQRRIKSQSYLVMLVSIGASIPDSVWLTELIGQPNGRIQLRGESRVYPEIIAFAQALKGDRLFSEVRLLDIHRLPAQSWRFGVQVQLAESADIL
ncbi:PilN domain-containing protein [Ewingella sp. S1.OA.A_B6]